MDIYEYNSSGHRNNICSDKTHTMVVKEGEKQLYERVRCQYLFKQETTVVSLHTLFNFNNNFFCTLKLISCDFIFSYKTFIPNSFSFASSRE